MNETNMKIREWWAGLASRERLAIVTGSCAVAIFIVYQWIWIPCLDHMESMRKQIAADQKTLQWMRAADEAIQKVETKSRGKNKAATPIVLLSNLQKQIKAAGFEQYLSQLKQATNDSIEMSFRKIEFDKLVRFLISVTMDQGLTITQMSATAENAPGIVTVDIVIK
jgi:general secretion pathway protein M